MVTETGTVSGTRRVQIPVIGTEKEALPGGSATPGAAGRGPAEPSTVAAAGWNTGGRVPRGSTGRDADRRLVRGETRGGGRRVGSGRGVPGGLE